MDLGRDSSPGSARPGRVASAATRACAALVALSLVVSGCSIPMGVRTVQVGTREERRPVERKVDAALRVEGGSVAVLRVSRDERVSVDTLAVYHRMAVRKDLTLLILGTVGVAATLFIVLLILAASSDSGGSSGGGGHDWDWD